MLNKTLSRPHSPPQVSRRALMAGIGGNLAMMALPLTVHIALQRGNWILHPDDTDVS